MKNAKSILLDLERINVLIQKYCAEKDALLQQVSASVVRQEHARGGELIHRGFYSPSLIEDIVIGNVNRGKLLKRLTKKPPDYRYGFDKDDRLVLVETFWEDKPEVYETEILIYGQDETVLGITYHKDGVIRISECQYVQGKIAQYARYYFNSAFNCIHEVWMEEYSYTPEELVAHVRTIFVPTIIPKEYKHIPRHVRKLAAKGSYSMRAYTFRLEDGYLKDYTCMGFVDEDDIPEAEKRKDHPYYQKHPFVPRTYQVYIERRIP